MNAFEAYQLYTALKLHFTTDYDFVKYHGKTSVSPTSFDTRRDKYHFHKLSKQEDPKTLVVANLFEDEKMWIGKMFDETSISAMRDFKKRNLDVVRQLKKETSSIESLNDEMIMYPGSQPALMKRWKQGYMSPETLIIINDHTRVFDYWTSKEPDDYIWKIDRKRLEDLRPFISYDLEKKSACRQILVDMLK